MSEQQIENQTNKTAPSVKEVITFLCEQFPSCFAQNENIKPLKKGIFQDLAIALENHQTISKTSLRHALRTYTRSWRYLAVCVENAERVGLNGEANGCVDAQEAEHAQIALKEAREAYEAKRQAQQEARKAFFKQKRETDKKRNFKKSPLKATAESLAALADKFAKK